MGAASGFANFTLELEVRPVAETQKLKNLENRKAGNKEPGTKDPNSMLVGRTTLMVLSFLPS
jgi:hypothetical protein